MTPEELLKENKRLKEANKNLLRSVQILRRSNKRLKYELTDDWAMNHPDNCEGCCQCNA